MRRIAAAFATLLVALAVVLPASAQQPAPPVEQPAIQPNDSWTYLAAVERNGETHETQQVITVVRVDGSGILVSAKDIDANDTGAKDTGGKDTGAKDTGAKDTGAKDTGSSTPPSEVLVGNDWSRFGKIDGKDTVVSRPLAFPLAVGKSWNVDYTADNPNPRIKKYQNHMIYSVTDWETVKVPAGTFKALKIEAEGQWTAELVPTAPAAGSTAGDSHVSTAAPTLTGHAQEAYWYAPEVKRMVKSDEKSFDSRGVVIQRLANQLESYKLANAGTGAPAGNHPQESRRQ